MSAADFSYVRTTLDYIILRLIQMEHVMAANFDALNAELAKERDLNTSIVSLINGLVQKVAEAQQARDAGDQAAVDNVLAQMQQNAQMLADAAVAGTGPDQSSDAAQPTQATKKR